MIKWMGGVIVFLSLLLSYTHYLYMKESSTHANTKHKLELITSESGVISQSLSLCLSINDSLNSVIAEREGREKEIDLTTSKIIGGIKDVKEEVEDTRDKSVRIVDFIHPDIDRLLHEAWGSEN